MNDNRYPDYYYVSNNNFYIPNDNNYYDYARHQELQYECPHKLCHINESIITTFTELDTIYEDDVNPLQRIEYKEWRKQVWGYNYPEFKQSTCEKEFKTKNPFGGWITHKQKYPCAYRRTTNAKAFFVVKYPATVEDAVKEHINNCAAAAAVLASKSIYAAVSASSATGVGVVPVAFAAIPAAFEVAKASFWECLTTYHTADVIKRLITTRITHEKKTGEWKRV
ncbi:hypothetical protein [Bacillus wiedmannii]|uniref:Uncharacterized protein n=1 Tax=Bacillus wiedmannii TaxID=1890302 RepID=A0A2C4NY41_9BACI|nr:hypothetical protein [Bacillus wiedmannii]PHD57685.1 hypothetical protein COF57_22705 [Bacillus wiedmannii]